MNFRGGLLHRRRRTWLYRLKLVLFHLLQRHFADIMTVRCVAFCNIYMLLWKLLWHKDSWPWKTYEYCNVRKLHWPRISFSWLILSIRFDCSLVVQHLRVCGVQRNARSVSSQDIHAQMTHCFSAAAELLVPYLLWKHAEVVLSVLSRNTLHHTTLRHSDCDWS